MFYGDDGDPSSDEDLTDVLESCTRKLGELCGGLNVEQLEEKNCEEMNSDTISSLEEVSDECAALLACLESTEPSTLYKIWEDDSTSEFSYAMLDQEGESQEQEHELASACQEDLTHDLDTFADELQELMSRLGDEHDGADYIGEAPLPAPSGKSENEERKSVHQDNFHREEDSSKSRAFKAETISFEHKAVYSKRTEQAVAVHVKRQLLRRSGSRVRSSASRASVHRRSETHTECVANVKIVWSNFQSSSFQRHVKRQQHARFRVKQAQTALNELEASRFQGTGKKPSKTSEMRDPTPSSAPSKPLVSEPIHRSYLDQFRTTSRPSPSDNTPKFLCAVYLHGLRRLGTTYITFNSLDQLQQRVRARFAISEVVGYYREVNDGNFPAAGNRGQYQKRLQRISTLEQVNDGDTICVTQSAYDDMTILCGWIKRRQRIVHSFEHNVQQAPITRSNSTDTTPPKKRMNSNGTTKPQVWDSNGRRLGVKSQLSILSDELWESNAQS